MNRCVSSLHDLWATNVVNRVKSNSKPMNQRWFPDVMMDSKIKWIWSHNNVCRANRTQFDVYGNGDAIPLIKSASNGTMCSDDILIVRVHFPTYLILQHLHRHSNRSSLTTQTIIRCASAFRPNKLLFLSLNVKRSKWICNWHFTMILCKR